MATRPEPENLVERHHRQVIKLINAIAIPQSDEAMNQALSELFAATTNLANSPTINPKDLNLKLDILCRRLRDHLDPDDRGSVLTYLLAASIREELGFRDVILTSANYSP
jgi:hypothetical protein